ncbi:erythromycin esterase family protein [Tenacibaculum xiamenense]|uniref:erythromycin esterase family protein n=1 Tax=Tenacibaculum xiamenense TaxID=1261553 RepID=UPI003895F2C6
MKNFLQVLLLTIFNLPCFSQCNPELKNYAAGFDKISITSFSFLDNELENVQIVGYGEDTHGTAEFTLLAQELMLYLSENHGFRLLILETGFGEGQYLNDYIQGKNNDLKFIMNNRNQTWRYRTKEFYQLMNNLKEYNRTHSEKIYLYGCEMQYVLSDISRIKDYLKLVGSTFKINNFEKFNLWENFDEKEKVSYFNSYAELKKHFIDNYKEFKSKSSEKEYQIAFHLVEVLGQFVTTINQTNWRRKGEFRDTYMCENIEWIMNLHQNQKKAVYWAHNAHVGDWVDNGNVDVTGHHLRRIYGDYYFNIATDFGKGEFIAYPADAHQTGNWRFDVFGHDQVFKDSFSYCLQKLGKPNTFFNFRKARRDNALFKYLNSELTTMSGAGAQVRSNKSETKKLGTAFDAVIYLNKTSKINWEE